MDNFFRARQGSRLLEGITANRSAAYSWRRDTIAGQWRAPVPAAHRHTKEDEPGIDRGLLHIERLKQASVAQEHREQAKHHAHVDDTEHRAAQDMLHLVVADLMRQHCHQFGHRMSGDQRIKERDALVLTKASKKGIRFTGTSRTVDHKHVLYGEIDGACIGKNGVF